MASVLALAACPPSWLEDPAGLPAPMGACPSLPLVSPLGEPVGLEVAMVGASAAAVLVVVLVEDLVVVLAEDLVVVLVMGLAMGSW